MSLAHLNLPQILDLWTELEDARLRKHSFGHNVAELYVYRSIAYSPSAIRHAEGKGTDLTSEAFNDIYRPAWQGIKELLTEFGKRRDTSVWFSLNPSAELEGDDYRHQWVAPKHINGIPTTHRYYVRVGAR